VALAQASMAPAAQLTARPVLSVPTAALAATLMGTDPSLARELADAITRGRGKEFKS